MHIAEAATIGERAEALHAGLRSHGVAPEEATRHRFLLGQGKGLCARIEVGSGETLPYWEEHRLVYRSGPLSHDPAAMDAVR